MICDFECHTCIIICYTVNFQISELLRMVRWQQYDNKIHLHPSRKFKLYNVSEILSKSNTKAKDHLKTKQHRLQFVSLNPQLISLRSFDWFGTLLGRGQRSALNKETKFQFVAENFDKLCCLTLIFIHKKWALKIWKLQKPPTRNITRLNI